MLLKIFYKHIKTNTKTTSHASTNAKVTFHLTSFAVTLISKCTTDRNEKNTDRLSSENLTELVLFRHTSILPSIIDVSKALILYISVPVRVASVERSSIIEVRFFQHKRIRSHHTWWLRNFKAFFS